MSGGGLHRSHAKEQRGKGGRPFSFSSQPKAYQDSIPLSHAKEQRGKGDRQGRGENHRLTQRSKGAKKTDRGGDRTVVSRKDAKGAGRFRLAVSRRRTRIRFHCLTPRSKEAKGTDRGGGNRSHAKEPRRKEDR